MPGLKKASIVLVVLSIMNSIAGYLREIVVAASFGAGSVTDAFFSSYAFVMTVNDLLITAALTASIIPSLGHFGEQLKKQGQLLSTALTIVISASALLALLLSTLFPLIIAELVPGLGEAELTSATFHGRWLVWLLPAYSLYFLFSLTLNAGHRFIAPGLAWLGINVIFTIVVISTADQLGDKSLLVGVMTGPMLMAALLGITVMRRVPIKPSLVSLSAAPVRHAWKLARPVIMSLGVGSSLGLLMISHLAVRGYGSFNGTGSVSALTYAFRIYEVPLTLAAHVAGTLILPIMVKYYADKDWDKIALLSRQLVFWGAMLLIPASMLIFFEAEILVRLLLERKNFTPDDSALTASALRGFAPAIVFEAVFVVYYRIFYALHRPQIPIIISLISLTILFAALQIQGTNSTVESTSLTLSISFFAASIAVFFFIHRIAEADVLPDFREAIWLFLTGAGIAYVWHYLSTTGSADFLSAMVRGITLPSLFWGILLWIFPEQRHRLMRFFHLKKSAAIV
ncbi:MAG: hypothetical protein JMN24_13225 [gamma proteobacterium endosymbiont of Lamellibrachia anaximandri]|nr:hypothetical protein [gamma proteobacterium endosymbiont of Lamellibrachia anaximandri]MBL3617340.1 hypothetical protein [gamma proteobacterium endosymbiont of Lamellibrachia anaximandri]